jgi:hypothetical protein
VAVRVEPVVRLWIVSAEAGPIPIGVKVDPRDDATVVMPTQVDCARTPCSPADNIGVTKSFARRLTVSPMQLSVEQTTFKRSNQA